MSGRKPLSGGMRLIERPLEIADEDAEQAATDKSGGGGGFFWGLIGWWFRLGLGIGAVLGLIAGFWGLYLAAAALARGMGL